MACGFKAICVCMNEPSRVYCDSFRETIRVSRPSHEPSKTQRRMRRDGRFDPLSLRTCCHRSKALKRRFVSSLVLVFSRPNYVKRARRYIPVGPQKRGQRQPSMSFTVKSGVFVCTCRVLFQHLTPYVRSDKRR